MTDQLTIDLGEKVIVLKLSPFSDLDVDDVLRIDYSNIIGEILTFSVLFNKIGLLRAEAQSLLRESNFEIEILSARLSDQVRRELKKDGVKDSNAKVDDIVRQNSTYIAAKETNLILQKQADYMEAIYWAAQSKDKKLDRLSHYLRPEEFANDIIEGQVNKILIRFKPKLIK